MTQKLSTTDAARLLDMRPAQIRQLVRSCLGSSSRDGRRYAFDFQDLVVLRTAKRLVDEQVPAARVQRALRALAHRLGAGEPLSAMRIFAWGRRVGVQDAHGCFDAETGQALLHFPTPGEVPTRPLTVPEIAAPSPVEEAIGDRIEEAERVFGRALQMEDTDLDEACALYEHAIELDPRCIDAYINLGRIAHEAGDYASAIDLYHRALDVDAGDPVVHFNLGLALEDSQGLSPAAEQYQLAIDLDPEFADAHFNLAGVFEKLDRPADALRHYHAYKKLTDLR